MGVLSNIEPKEVFEQFEAISMVPRRTYKNEKISDFLVQFAKDHGLRYVQEKCGNVIIYKDGTPGYENAEPVILQGHMDMVASKTVDSDHDFDSEPLDLFVDGDLIGARDTTLGADDGFALAFALAILASDSIAHPPVEALFTVDEEIGMGGASELDVSLLKGKKFFNMDGEEEGALTVGCAGAFIGEFVIPFNKTEKTGIPVTIRIRDYHGGHSGNTIQEQHGNAHKDMGRLLYYLSRDFDIALRSVEGGTGANVIAQFCTAEIVVSTQHADRLISRVEEIRDIFKSEYMGQEDDMSITAEGGEYSSYDAMDKESTLNVIRFLYASLDGVQTMDRVIEGNVETSLNAGVVVTDKDDSKVRVSIQARSSVDSKLDDMLSKLTIWGDMTGGYVNVKSAYPAWPYNPDSVLRPLMVDVYSKMYGKDPEVVVSHGGLEGGILMGKQPEFDIVCFGPDLRGVHTPDERISISSTQRTWEYLKEVLKKCK